VLSQHPSRSVAALASWLQVRIISPVKCLNLLDLRDPLNSQISTEIIWIGYDAPDWLRKEISLARELLHTSAQDTVRIGVGFLCWLLDKSPSEGKELLDIALASRVQAIWLSFGEDIGAWVNYVREHDPRAGSADAVMIFVQISTVAQALAALKEWKADVIVAQGSELALCWLSQCNAMPQKCKRSLNAMHRVLNESHAII
jgi:hypothetical protein